MADDVLIARLKELRDMTTKLCEEASRVPYREQPTWAVNFGDLSCRSVAHCIDGHGTEFDSVFIEEASPDNYGFQMWIAEKLAERGFPNVRVYTDW